ncbi:MAG: hypothetical protein AAGG75_06085 [Bacteroidota bacterium]
MIASLLLLSFSCTKDKEKTSDQHKLPNAPELIDQYNIGRLAHQQAELVEGAVYIRAASENTIVIMVNNKALADTTIVYQLQLEELTATDLSVALKQAQVLFFRNSLVVNSTVTDAMYAFQLSSAQPQLQLKDNTIPYLGFGLSRALYFPPVNEVTSRAGFGIPGDPPPVAGCSCTSIITKDCDSGGPGSSSCSGAYGPNGTQCSVSCESNDHSVRNWACCD